MLESFVAWLLSWIGNSLFVMGLLLVFIAVFLKDQASIGTTGFKPATLFKKTFNPLPTLAYKSLIVIGLVSVLAGMVQTLLNTNKKEESNLLGVSLVGATFEAGDWNPRIIDFRTSKEMGIHVEPKSSLELHNLQVMVPDNIAAGYFSQVRVFANENIFIGKTNAVALVPDTVVLLGDVMPENYKDADVEKAWRVDGNWDKLLFKLEILTEKGSNPIASINYYVKLTDDTQSWYLYPPYGNIASIVYSVNDGPEYILDLRIASNDGIDVQAGDVLVLKEVWVKSLRDSEEQLAVLEAYPSSGAYDGKLLVTSEKKIFKNGLFNMVTDDRFQWEIPVDKTSIVVTLTREDNTLLDRYVIPFTKSQPAALLQLGDAITWPKGLMTYLDFEKPTDVEEWSKGWGDGDLATFTITDQEYFSGGHSVAVIVSDDGKKTFMLYDHPFKANYIMGQVYWPKQDDIYINWAEVCLGKTDDCVGIPLELGSWNTFVFDLSRPAKDGTPQNQMTIPNFWIQGQIIGVTNSNSYTFFVDGIQIYLVNTP